MPNPTPNPHPRRSPWQGLLPAGALCGMAASILLMYLRPAYLLYALAAGLWLAACQLGRTTRPAWASARKFLVLLLALCLVQALPPDGALDGTIRVILSVAVGVLFYFSAAVVCTGCAAPDGQPGGPPPVVAWFEYCAIGFVACRLLSNAFPEWSFLADVVSMGAFTAGFGLLLRYFWGPAAAEDQK